MSIYKQGRPQKYNPTTGGGSIPPHKPGEYRIRDNSGSITYIGETCDLRRRAGEHINSGKLAIGENGGTFEFKVADGRSTSATRRIHERAKIAEHKPSLNRSNGGEGRLAKR